MEFKKETAESKLENEIREVGAQEVKNPGPENRTRTGTPRCTVIRSEI